MLAGYSCPPTLIQGDSNFSELFSGLVKAFPPTRMILVKGSPNLRNDVIEHL